MRPLTKEIIKQTMLFGLIMGIVGGGALYLRTESLGGLAFGFLFGLSGGLIMCIIASFNTEIEKRVLHSPRRMTCR